MASDLKKDDQKEKKTMFGVPIGQNRLLPNWDNLKDFKSFEGFKSNLHQFFGLLGAEQSVIYTTLMGHFIAFMVIFSATAVYPDHVKNDLDFAAREVEELESFAKGWSIKAEKEYSQRSQSSIRKAASEKAVAAEELFKDGDSEPLEGLGLSEESSGGDDEGQYDTAPSAETISDVAAAMRLVFQNKGSGEHVVKKRLVGFNNAAKEAIKGGILHAEETWNWVMYFITNSRNEIAQATLVRMMKKKESIPEEFRQIDGIEASAGFQPLCRTYLLLLAAEWKLSTGDPAAARNKAEEDRRNLKPVAGELETTPTPTSTDDQLAALDDLVVSLGGAKLNNEDKVKLFIAAMRRSECTSLEETGKAVQGIVDDHLFSYFHPDDGSKIVNPKLPSYVQILTKAKAHFARQQLTLEQEASKGGKAVKAKEKAKPKDKGSGGKEVNQTANGAQSAQGGGKGKGKKNGKGKGKGGHSGDSGKGPKGGKGGTRTAVCLICNGDHLFSWNNNGVPFHLPEEQKRLTI